jgi:hypothetical protein
MSKNTFFLLTLALIALVQVSPAPVHALDLSTDRLASVTLPPGMQADPLPTFADMDGDSLPEALSLVQGRLEILSAGQVVWQSPPEWDVIQAGFTWLIKNGRPQATLLVWRPFRPWPVDRWLPNGGRIAGFQDANGDSCHIILIGWLNGRYGEVWAGSALAEPVKSFLPADLDMDGIQELVTIESDYSIPRSLPGSVLKVWEWNGFGFTVVSSMKGSFSALASARTHNGHILILVP